MGIALSRMKEDMEDYCARFGRMEIDIAFARSKKMSLWQYINATMRQCNIVAMLHCNIASWVTWVTYANIVL